VSLVTALHLRPVSEPSSESQQENQPPPPPYHAAEEKLHAVQEGAEPSYASVAKGEASPPPSPTTTMTKHGGKDEGGKSGSKTTRYYITKQEDLYQVNEFLKFVSMTPGAMVAGVFQLWATLMCLLGALVLGPFVRSGLPARSGKKGVKG
jgi:hypothetical protein